MCLMAPGRVIAIEAEACVVDIAGRQDRVATFGEPDLRVGDWVVVAAGTVVRRLDPEQAGAMAEAAATVYADPRSAS